MTSSVRIAGPCYHVVRRLGDIRYDVATTCTNVEELDRGERAGPVSEKYLGEGHVKELAAAAISSV